MIKKIIATLIIIITFLCISVPLAKASEGTITSEDREKFDKIGISSEVEVESSEGKSQVVGLEVTENQNNTLIGTLAKVLAVIPYVINRLMSTTVYEESFIEDTLGTVIFGQADTYFFTIEGLLTNKYNLFDIDLFTQVSSGPQSTFSNTIKNQAAIWYTAIRNVSIVGCMIVAIYVGIRLAIATTAQDTAKYKKMLTGWVIGIILLFLMHYIVLIMIRVSDVFIRFITTAIEKDTNTTSMEMVVLKDVFKSISTSSGFSKIYFLLLYSLLTFYEMKFFVIYLFRVLKIFIMMVISPLVCMTYPIDTLRRWQSTRI